MSTNESAIHLIDCLSGEEKKRIHCKSSGVGQIKYTHNENCILVSSEKRNKYDIKYLCLYDNRYLRSFSGHTDMLTSISMSPVDDIFITASLDRTVRRWDLNSPKETARIQLSGLYSPAVANFDSAGLVFGVMAKNLRDNSHTLRLYDARNFDAGPFQDIAPSSVLQSKVISEQYPVTEEENRAKPNQSNWTSFQFTPDGNHIFINTDSDIVWLLDSFRSEVAPKLLGPRKNESCSKLGACVTTDCQHVLVGNEENEIQIYDKATGGMKGFLSGHVAPIGCIASNPRYDMFASSCVNTVLWIPKEPI